MEWPKGFDPSSPSFETQARKLRYQALGRACREAKAFGLILGHHADDQAETVMMRIANNRVRLGLQAMPEVYGIPECEGEYGIYNSGQRQPPNLELNIPFAIENGGINVYRPLLAFEKSRLIATCKEMDVPWIEDRTNHVPTLTSRNAIRCILKNHKLPEALSIQSLCEVSDHMKRRIDQHKARAQELFDKCPIKLDIQTASLIVRFPPSSALLSRPIETEQDKIEAKDIAFCLAALISDLVAPRPQGDIGVFATVIDAIYPEFCDGEDMDFALPGSDEFETKHRCVKGVWWRHWKGASPFEVSEEGLVDTESQAREWYLTRQIPVRSEIDTPRHRMLYPPRTVVSGDSRSSLREQQGWQLFDHRFWIRLQNLSNDHLVLRLFRKNDLQQVPSGAEEKDFRERNDGAVRPHRFISAAFSLLPYFGLRNTLPVVFRVDPDTGKEMLIGFPTLDVRMDGFGAWDGVCEWSVRYKKIELGNRGPGDIVIPGLSRGDIIREYKRQIMDNKGIRRLSLGRHSQSDKPIHERPDKKFAFKRLLPERTEQSPGTRHVLDRRSSPFVWKSLSFKNKSNQKD